MSNAAVDVLILGAGPAGLAVASGLARQLHSAIVFSRPPSTTSTAPAFRNARAKHMHNVLGWDHADPAAFRAQARQDLGARYEGIVFRDVEVVGVKVLGKSGQGTRFEVEDADGHRYEGRKVVLASGVRDIMPAIPGYEELWGRGIFHCLFCHGFEERGSPSAGVLASGLLAAPMFAPAIARMAGRLAGVVNIYTNGDEAVGAQVRPLLRSTKKFRFDHRKIKSLAKDPDVAGEAGVLVTLEDGSVVKEGFLAHVPDSELNGPFVKDLGVELTPQGYINTLPPFQNTNVPGVFAAGDCATMMKAIPTAMMMGSTVAAGLAHALQAEDDVAE